MFNVFLLNASQKGIPTSAWVVVGVIIAIILLVVSIKSFWVSKVIACLISIVGIVTCILLMKGEDNIFGLVGFLEDIGFLKHFDLNPFQIGAILCALIFAVMYVFLLGNLIFDSGTEGDYLIFGSLLHDTNHPISAFFEGLGICLFMGGLIFWAAYAWTFVIGLVAFILVFILSIAIIIERIKS